MKTKLLILSLLLIASCSNNKQAQRIEDFVSTIDGVKSDLKFKSIELKESTTVTSTDSMLYAFFEARYSSEAEMSSLRFIPVADSFIVTIIRVDGKQFEDPFKIEEIDRNILITQEYAENMRSLFQDAKNIYGRNSEEAKEIEDDINRALEDIKLYEKAKKYSLIPPQTVISRSFECTYTIFNPILQVNQTMTKKFYFDNSLSKVLKASD